MLYSEAASERIPPKNPTDNSKITAQIDQNPAMIPGRWGETIYSQIRRFVVIRVHKNHFVEAWYVHI